MEKLKHTKGQWEKIDFKNNKIKKIAVYDPKTNCNNEIAMLRYNNKKELKANARLIACAPEMLKRFISMVSNEKIVNPEFYDYKYRDIITLIEKATNQKIEDIIND